MPQSQTISFRAICLCFVLAFAAGGLLVFQQQGADARSRSVSTTPVTYELGMSVNGKETRKNPAAAHVEQRKRAVKNLGKENPLPLPSSMSVADFENQMFDFLNERVYADELAWLSDKRIRDTGPFIAGKYYGTHPAVRVYYSPGIIKWLQGGRVGEIPDGEMIIKEQYQPPAIRHAGKSEDEIRESLESWTVMVKDSAGSQDGWFWSNPVADQKVTNNHQYPFDHPVSGFGHYCIRCHGSAQSAEFESTRKGNEFTFSALRNIEGFPGEPMVFRVDDSWREQTHNTTRTDVDQELERKLGDLSADWEIDHDSHPRIAPEDCPESRKLVLNRNFLEYYDSIAVVAAEQVQRIPPVTHDWVVNETDDANGLVTSNQCMSCHAGGVEPFGPTMFVPMQEGQHEYGDAGWHVSPYGEWRWTAMGLAGRDPVFYAQLESEVEILKNEFSPEMADDLSRNLVDTCLRCHGAMGKHQFDREKTEPEAKYTIEHVHLTAGEDTHIGKGEERFGALSRDGISCVICHRMQPRPQPTDDERPYLQFFLEHSTTGKFHLGPEDEIYGPFKDEEISPYVMEHSLGMLPKQSDYLSSSQMCGTCHTVNLPVVDRPLASLHPDERELDLVAGETVEVFKDFKHHVEQATYLEWLNSEYENEFNKDNPLAKSCQDCHMSKGLRDDRNDINIDQIVTRIATIQDTTYPDAENLTSYENLEVRVRESGYRRHNFSGLNAFLLEMVKQYDEVLGVRKNDFMTGSRMDVDNAIENFKLIAQTQTAQSKLSAEKTADKLLADVNIQSLVGHRFPSGVGFRRAFLELLVIENEGTSTEKIVWSSGRTNELGVLIGQDGKPLASESFARDASGTQQFQQHHQVIKSPQQVQVYETLLWNDAGEFTTSFIHGCDVVKDNRFLPKGWKQEGPAPGVLTGNFLHATHPGKTASLDPAYQDGSGSDTVRYEIALSEPTKGPLTIRATLFYQAMPPYFLKNLFQNAPNGEATKRLHYMLSNLDLKGTAVEDWKLFITSDSIKLD